jgi:autotransporter-associated beta strand protein
LTGTFTSNATDRELELAGSTVGNIFSGALVNGSNTALLTKTGGGTWTVSGGSNTFTGRTKVIGGTLKLTNNLAIQNSVFDTSGAGALDTEGVTTPTFGGLTLGGNLVLHSNVTSLTLKVAGTQTYSGSLSGGTALALSKSGAGTQVLSNSNNYSGATSVSEGILNIAHNSALGSNSAVAITSTITAGGVLELANGITVTGKNITISGFGTGVRGSLRAATGAAAEWAGQVVIGGSSSPTDTRVGAMGNGTLTISGAIVNGTLNTFIVSAENAASATPGKVIVSGTSNTYSGQTQIFRGILAIGANNALPTGTVLNVHSASGISDTAQFDLNGYNQQVAGLLRGNNSGPAIVTNTGGTTKTLTINNTDVYTFDSAITGNLALVKDGAAKQTLSGTNTYNGATTINEGTLALGAAGSIDSTSGVALGGGTFDVSAKTGGYTVNNLTGSGNVVGGLTVSTELSIGNSPGQINFGGNLTLGTTLVAADFNYEFTGGDTAADLGIVSGDLTLDSKVFLNLFQLGNYTPGDTFTLFAYEGSLIGTFIGLADGDTIMDDQLNSWKIEYAATSAGQNYSGLVGQTYVNITAIPEPNVAALLGALGTLILLRRRRA